MAKLTDPDINFLRLLMRSPDIGDGWRQASGIVWYGYVLPFKPVELIEIDEPQKRVRLSERGKIVVEYL